MTRELFDPRLHAMIKTKRPHGTDAEFDFATQFLMPYQPQLAGDLDTMAYIVTVGSGSKVLFSCHVDTVHHKPGKQKVFYRPEDHRYYKKDDEPLGADDTAGCWLLLEMIDAGIPGTYIFHRGEERGGIGSKWVSSHLSDWLKQFDYAIAFDRKALDSVITRQGGSRCCSDKFAQALSDAFNAVDDNLMYSPDDTGVYTDTAEYTDDIPECTNVSCGYYSEHTMREELDLFHLFALRDACLKVDWAALPVERKLGDDDFASYGRSSCGTNYYRKWETEVDTTSLDFYEMEYGEI